RTTAFRSEHRRHERKLVDATCAARRSRARTARGAAHDGPRRRALVLLHDERERHTQHHAARHTCRARHRLFCHRREPRRALRFRIRAMSSIRVGIRASLLVAWIAVLAVLAFLVHRELEIGTDLRLFLPNPTTAEERLLVEEIGEGAGSRVLVLALSGASAQELADASRELRAALENEPFFRFVANGELSLDTLPDSLLPYRYLLSDTLDEHAFDAAYLRSEIQARARDLASPAGAFLEPWLPRDPTLELLNVLQRWQPAQEPHRLYVWWFERAGEPWLLLAATLAPACDSLDLRAGIEARRARPAAIDPAGCYARTSSGTGPFPVRMEQRSGS